MRISGLKVIISKFKGSMGGFVYREKPDLTKHSKDGESPQLRFGSCEMQGWRQNMEDAHLVDLKLEPNTSIFGVFDGHGGSKALIVGPEVAKLCEIHLSKELMKSPSYKMQEFEAALRETFIKMDTFIDSENGRELILKLSKNRPAGEKKESPLADVFSASPSDQFLYECQGCTSVVALLKGTMLYVANAGDSRAVLGINGEAVDMSKDHKPELEEERKRIEKAGSSVIEGRVDGNLNLSRSIGDLKYKRGKFLKPEEQPITSNPDIRKRDIKGADFLVLACDGIWEGKSSQDVVDFIYAKMKKNPGSKLSTIIENLFDELVSPNFMATGKLSVTIAGVGCDNMTCVIVQFKGSF